jgi:hypothetical protein
MTDRPVRRRKDAHVTPRFLLPLVPVWLAASLLMAAAPAVESPAVDPQAVATARLNGARDSLDELENLIAEARALSVSADADRQGSPWFPENQSHRSAPPPKGVNLDQLDQMLHRLGEQRARLAALEGKLAATNGAEVVYREAGVIVRWAVETGAPLHQLVQARRRADLDRLRDRAEVAWSAVTTLDHAAGDPLVGAAGQQRSQARAAWDDGDLVAAQRHYEAVLELCRGLQTHAEQRGAALRAEKQAEQARRSAARHQAERLAAGLWLIAEQLREQAEAAAAAHRYVEAGRSWSNAALAYEQAGVAGERLVRLEQARLEYEELVKGLTGEDLQALGARRQDMDHFVNYAEDERNDSEARTEHYRAAVRHFRSAVAALRLGKARVLLAQGETGDALDQLAEGLRQTPADAEIRRLFNEAVVGQSDWWLSRARAESLRVTQDRSRLVLYELLARTRRLLGNRKGSEQAVGAAVVLLRKELRARPDMQTMLRLTCFCLERKDLEALQALLALATETIARLPPDERPAWQAWAAVVAERSGDRATADRFLQEVRRSTPEPVTPLDPASTAWRQVTGASPGDLDPVETAVRRAWRLARAAAVERKADLAELLTEIFEVPDAAGRCAAFLGVAAGLNGPVRD